MSGFCKQDGNALPCSQHGSGFAMYETELPLPARTLGELLEMARLHVITPEEAEAQRQSWVRGEMRLDRGGDGYAKTTVFPLMHGAETGRFSATHPNESNTPKAELPITHPLNKNILDRIVVNVPASIGGNITYEMLQAAAGRLYKEMPLTFSEYQRRAHATAVFPHHIPDELAGVVYCALGLAGEAGEVAGKVKKLVRDGDSDDKRRKIVDELGDTLWYIPELLNELGEFTLEQAARDNLEKLFGRRERNTIHGDGDVR